jgi:hypothetical protein
MPAYDSKQEELDAGKDKKTSAAGIAWLRMLRARLFFQLLPDLPEYFMLDTSNPGIGNEVAKALTSARSAAMSARPLNADTKSTTVLLPEVA